MFWEPEDFLIELVSRGLSMFGWSLHQVLSKIKCLKAVTDLNSYDADIYW